MIALRACAGSYSSAKKRLWVGQQTQIETSSAEKRLGFQRISIVVKHLPAQATIGGKIGGMTPIAN